MMALLIRDDLPAGETAGKQNLSPTGKRIKMCAVSLSARLSKMQSEFATEDTEITEFGNDRGSGYRVEVDSGCGLRHFLGDLCVLCG
jgi:hypothetical protein